MKRFASATAALVMVSLGNAVLAADMPVKAPPVVVQNWTGCYVGVDAGLNWGHNNGFSTTAASTQGTGGPPVPGNFVGNVTDGIWLNEVMTLGAFGGCNYQVARWVIGLEGDWSFTDTQGGARANAAAVAAGFNPQRFWQTDERWFETARLRLGYAVGDRWLWYVTGGGAWAKINSFQAALNNIARFNAAEDTVRGGWAAGFGTEYMFARGWSIRGEFLYLQFPSYAAFATTPPTSAMLTNMITGKIQDYVVRVGSSYKFDWTP